MAVLETKDLEVLVRQASAILDAMTDQFVTGHRADSAVSKRGDDFATKVDLAIERQVVDALTRETGIGVHGDKLINERLQAGRPVLGICVGMQILFERGIEFGVESAGCGQWPGAVTRLDAPVIPHMGWNVVEAAAGSTLFQGLDPATRFYFVHSYAAQRWTGSSGALLTWAAHQAPFLAAVEDGPLSATQFHPEKSGDAGAALLSNWVEGL